jgi:hypothetical protein
MVLSDFGLNLSYFNLKITVIFVNFREGFHKMAEKKYLQVFPAYYTFIFLSFPFFDNSITLVKYEV